MDERPKFETPYNLARRIVCAEWQAAVREFGLTPGSVTEKVTARIINRLDETAWPNEETMRLNEYQDAASRTAIYPDQGQHWGGLIYCALKLNGEAGEVADKIGKAIRDEGGLISSERREALILELGDVLWYIANMARELNASLDQVATKNLAKLAARKAHGTLRGDGDNR